MLLDPCPHPLVLGTLVAAIQVPTGSFCISLSETPWSHGRLFCLNTDGSSHKQGVCSIPFHRNFQRQSGIATHWKHCRPGSPPTLATLPSLSSTFPYPCLCIHLFLHLSSYLDLESAYVGNQTKTTRKRLISLCKRILKLNDNFIPHSPTHEHTHILCSHERESWQESCICNQ